MGQGQSPHPEEKVAIAAECEEFDSAFTRLDHVEECVDETRFDLMWHRHTGQWWRLHTSAALEEALHLVETEPLLQPFL